MTKEEKLSRFFSKETPWKSQIAQLRALLISSELTEDWKWNYPTYTLEGKNVIAISSFKDHYGLWFFQGVFLKDTHSLLRNAQEGKTKAMRSLSLTADDPFNLGIIEHYVNEAIQNSKDGKEIKASRAVKKVVLPIMLKNALYNDSDLKNHFDALSIGKRGEYATYIDSAKQEATKQRRLEKSIDLILQGKGLNDKYK